MMPERPMALAADVDAELERIVSELAAAQQKRRDAVRRRLRRQIVAMLTQQGFHVGDIFPLLRHASGGRHAP